MIYYEEQKDDYITTLTNELPVLRARIRISQAELARGVGISRQTYSLIETQKQKMTWVTFMAIIAFFSANILGSFISVVSPLTQSISD